MLPTSTTGDQFYVLKRNTNLTNAVSYLGFYNSTKMGLIVLEGNYAFENGAATMLSIYNTNIIAYLYQGLSTTQKQW